MRKNKLREMLDADLPTIGTHLHTTSPTWVEVIGHTGAFDYVEYTAEYSAFDFYALDNFCRAVELYDMSAMIKVEQQPRTFIAQRAIGSGFQSVLFADCRTVDDVRECVRAARPDTPEGGGTYGVAMRRSTYMLYGGTAEFVQALKDIVVVLMVEKKDAVDNLDEILSLGGIDMIQWGPADYCMSIGRPGPASWSDPETKEVERHVIKTALSYGIQPRAEISSPDAAKYYLDLGVKHFCIGTDIFVLYDAMKQNGEKLRQVIKDA